MTSCCPDLNQPEHHSCQEPWATLTRISAKHWTASVGQTMARGSYAAREAFIMWPTEIIIFKWYYSIFYIVHDIFFLMRSLTKTLNSSIHPSILQPFCHILEPSNQIVSQPEVTLWFGFFTVSFLMYVGGLFVTLPVLPWPSLCHLLPPPLSSPVVVSNSPIKRSFFFPCNSAPSSSAVHWRAGGAGSHDTCFVVCVCVFFLSHLHQLNWVDGAALRPPTASYYQPPAPPARRACPPHTLLIYPKEITPSETFTKEFAIKPPNLRPTHSECLRVIPRR